MKIAVPFLLLRANILVSCSPPARRSVPEAAQAAARRRLISIQLIAAHTLDTLRRLGVRDATEGDVRNTNRARPNWKKYYTNSP